MNNLILYIEDNALHMRLVKKFLEPIGYQLLEGTNGYQGLALAQANTPALILLDFNLPDISGYDVIKALRKVPELRNIPVIAVTSAEMIHQQGFLDAGFNGFIHKPINREILLLAISAFIGTPQYR